VDKVTVCKEDLVNHAFATDKKVTTGARFIPRRIAHPNFKNVAS